MIETLSNSKWNQLNNLFEIELVCTIEVIQLLAIHIEHCNNFSIPVHWYDNLRF